MSSFTRRDFFKWAALGATTGHTSPGHSAQADRGALGKTKLVPTPSRRDATPPAEIYRLLGFATMSGEDPLNLWARLRETKEWLVGPLAPDCWSGQVFVADHADIFAFRFLSIPAAWMRDYGGGNRAEFSAGRFRTWWARWPEWWRTVGPKAGDNSYVRLVWQMPDDGPEVTYEWAQTDRNEVICRITHSAPSDLVIQGYIPWDWNPPQFSVLYSDGPERLSWPGIVYFLVTPAWIRFSDFAQNPPLIREFTYSPPAGLAFCPPDEAI